MTYPVPTEVRALLGTMTDRAISERFGVPHGVARGWRLAAGVSPHRRRCDRRPLPADLGERSDAEIGRREGVSRGRVGQWRSRAGVPKFQPPSRQRAVPPRRPLPWTPGWAPRGRTRAVLLALRHGPRRIGDVMNQRADPGLCGKLCRKWLVIKAAGYGGLVSLTELGWDILEADPTCEAGP